MPVHCRIYIHFDGARKPENRKNTRDRLMVVLSVRWMTGAFVLGFIPVRFLLLGIGGWETYALAMISGSGTARIGNDRRGADEGNFSIGRGIRAGVRVSGVFVAHWERFHRHGVESFGKVSSFDAWIRRVLSFSAMACQIPGTGEAKGDGAASSFVRSRSREIFSSLVVGVST